MKRTRGFTIIEMLVVIFVIGVLATLILIVNGQVQKQARDNKRQTDIQIMRQALEKFFEANGQYPPGCTQTYTIAACNQDANLVLPNTSSGGLIFNDAATRTAIRAVLPTLPDNFGDPKDGTPNTPFAAQSSTDRYNYYYGGGYLALNNTVQGGIYVTTPNYKQCWYALNINASGDTSATDTRTINTTYIIGYYSEVQDKWIIYRGAHNELNRAPITLNSTYSDASCSSTLYP